MGRATSSLFEINWAQLRLSYQISIRRARELIISLSVEAKLTGHGDGQAKAEESSGSGRGSMKLKSPPSSNSCIARRARR